MARSWPSTRTDARISHCSDEARPEGVGGLVYQPFDLLYLDGRLLLDVPLEDRKRLLQSVLKAHPRVRFASHIVGDGEAFFEAAGANRSRA
jgi:bifunctional non-homologous end joining protein LigD